MLYEALKETLLELLQAPAQPPEPPLGSPDSVQVFRASPRYLTLQLIRHFGSMGAALLFELLGWATLVPVPGGKTVFAVVATLIVGSTLLLMVVRYFLIRIDYDMRFYVLTDRSLRIRRGAWTVEESTYTFANVQNITLHQGPLERWLGITHLQVETAGGSTPRGGSDAAEGLNHQGRLDGIDPDTATELRDRILRHIREYRDAGLGDEPARTRQASVISSASLLRAIVDELKQIRPAPPPSSDRN
ncbi:MAG TPA: PH domain-containing protein [Polyangiaceae bacterium]|jgi:membrane protein YdbS with pleckstrin-like domain|nr:PH domain-containing protein [Polyangiaceae bacterium]